MSLRELLNEPEWLVEEKSFDPHKINFYETIFTVGNGYQGTRGALEEDLTGGLPATYLAGVFDPHDSTVVDLVNAPDWLPLKIYVEGEALSMHTCKIVDYRRALDIKQGVLYRLTVFEDSQGRRTRYESIRFASFSHQNLCGIRALVTPENYSGTLTIESGLDGKRYNLDRLPHYVDAPAFPPETKWEKWAKSKHLQQVSSSAQTDSVYLEMKTIDRGHHLGYTASLEVAGAEATRSYRKDYQKISELLTFEAQQGTTYRLDKLVAITTSRETEADRVRQTCLETLSTAKQQGFDACLQANADFWAGKWADCDCIIQGDDQANHAVRFTIYHLLIMANENDPKVNIGAKSLTGEGYKGHVFWDTEIFLLPFYIYTQPETAKALLLYRYHCLEAALENAWINGFKGSQYPWESADTGAETTPKWTEDRQHRIWTGEEEVHITADVAYGILTYLTATDDWQFFFDYGAEILFNTARFWESRLELNQAQDRYELNRVIGPDEFHEHVDNNVFTNWMAQWNLHKAVELYGQLKETHPETLVKIAEHLDLQDGEVNRWQEMAGKIYIPFDRQKKLIEQFEGYFQCKEEPITQWDENDMPVYPAGYDHFNAQETTLVKQPDVVMLMYVLPDEFDDEVKRINYDFYEERTMHKSSLSPAIHSIMGIEVGETKRAVQYFLRSALVDLIDNQGNTEMGMHAASAGGTWMCVVFGFGGFRVKNQQMTFKPWLPADWKELRFQIKWHGDKLQVCIRPNEALFYLDAQQTKTEEIIVFNQTYALPSGQEVSIPLNV